jgi:hypothetical protein
MIIKKKSIAVAVLSSFVVSMVLMLTLVGYVIYTELKGEEFRKSYYRILKDIYVGRVVK